MKNDYLIWTGIIALIAVLVLSQTSLLSPQATVINPDYDENIAFGPFKFNNLEIERNRDVTVGPDSEHPQRVTERWVRIKYAFLPDSNKDYTNKIFKVVKDGTIVYQENVNQIPALNNNLFSHEYKIPNYDRSAEYIIYLDFVFRDSVYQLPLEIIFKNNQFTFNRIGGDDVLEECSEDDNGRDSTKKATVYRFGEPVAVDSCRDQNTVNEFYCLSNGQVQQTTITCTNGCFDGSCNQDSSSSCTILGDLPPCNTINDNEFNSIINFWRNDQINLNQLDQYTFLWRTA